MSERGQLGVFFLLIAGAVVLVTLTLTLLLGMQLVGTMANDLGDTKPPHNKTAHPDPITGEAVSFEDTSGRNRILKVYQVNDSTGYAIQLTGAEDSYYQSHADINLSADETWSVSTWARVDGDASGKTMTAVSANGRAVIQYNGTQGNWTAWYYDGGSTNSYTLNATAHQPGNLSLLTLTSNGTHLRFYRNNTQTAVQNLSVESIESGDVNASNWDGTLDETRVFDDATNDSEQADLFNNPVAPRPARNRTARLMFDEGEGATTAIYFTDTYADLSNVSWTTQGLAGHTLTDGTDYTLDAEAGTITALAGGRIDGAPVVWINYRYEVKTQVGVVGTTIGAAFALFGQAVLIIPAVAIIGVLIAAIIGGISQVARRQR